MQEVWIRPRHVFRALSSRPVGATDYALGAAQGVVAWLAYSRAEDAGAADGVAQILGRSLLLGSVLGVTSLLVSCLIYTRLGARSQGAAQRHQVMHVFSYGGLPTAVSLIVWLFAALLVGEATFRKVQAADTDGFVALLLDVQIMAYCILALWSVLLQVMGLSEIQRISVRRAFLVWVVGQVLAFLVGVFSLVLLSTLFPNALTS